MTDQLSVFDNLDEDVTICRCPRCQRREPRWPDWIAPAEQWRQIETVQVTEGRL